MADDFDPGTVTWVLTPADLDRLVAAIEEADEVVMDLETTGLDEHATTGGPTNGGVAARIVLASFTLPSEYDPNPSKPTTWLLPGSHPESPWIGTWRKAIGRAAQAVVNARRALTNQHVKFDAKWIQAQTGVDLSEVITWDTMVSSHLLDETRTTRLKVRASQTFGVPPWDDFDLSTPGAAERVPLVDLGMYAARDTYWTWRLADLHRDQMFLPSSIEDAVSGVGPETPDEVEDARLGRLATWVAMPTIRTLTAIEQRGFMLDDEWCRKELEQHNVEAIGLTADLAALYPDLDPADASFAPTSLWFMRWAEAAVAAGDLAITALTPNGRPSWGKAVLVRQARAGSQVATDLLELKSHTKKAEFLTSWLHHQAPDGAIHTTYNAGRVVSGRLSSSDPNMQQVTSSLKPAFIPRPGMVLIDFDYSQIELRVAAYISRCVPMIEAFVRGDDLHRMLAANITGKPLAEVTPAERQGGKSANFGLLYSMSPGGFITYAETVYGVSFTMDEAQHVHRTFFDTWIGLADWHAKAIRRAHNTGQVVSPIGRVRRLPDIHDHDPRKVGDAERRAINSPVQGFASDIMQIAAASIAGTLPGHQPVQDCYLVGTVHDSIVAEAPIDRWEPVVEQCRERMTVAVLDVLRKLDCAFDVPLVADAKVGTRWGLADVSAA